MRDRQDTQAASVDDPIMVRRIVDEPLRFLTFVHAAPSADSLRSVVERVAITGQLIRQALTQVPPSDRDAWLDRVLELHEIPDDSPDLPRGCVPYLPCPSIPCSHGGAGRGEGL